jgi:hypothetical protein
MSVVELCWSFQTVPSRSNHHWLRASQTDEVSCRRRKVMGFAGAQLTFILAYTLVEQTTLPVSACRQRQAG